VEARKSAGEPDCGVCGNDGGPPAVDDVLVGQCGAVQMQCLIAAPSTPVDSQSNIQCCGAADGMDTLCETLATAKEELVGSAAVAYGDYRAWVNRVHAQLDEHRRRLITEARQMCKSTGKALEAEMDELVVSAGQLRVCAAVCDRTLDGPTGRNNCMSDTLEYSRRAVAQLSELASAQSGYTGHMELVVDADIRAVLKQHAAVSAVVHQVCIPIHTGTRVCAYGTLLVSNMFGVLRLNAGTATYMFAFEHAHMSKYTFEHRHTLLHE